MLIRKSLLIACGLLVAAAFAALAMLLQGIDLNDFRRQFEQRLSAALARPVHLGEAHFSLRHGPAFSFSDLRLEPAAENDWTLSAERLYVRLDMTALLHRQVLIDRVVLHGARLHLPLSPAATPSSPLPDLTGRFPEIGSLAVHGGILVLEDRRHPAPPPPVVLEGIEVNLTDIAAGEPGWLSLRGRLRQPAGAAEVRLAGEIVPSADWHRIEGRLALKVDRWAPSVLTPLFVPEAQVPGKASLQVTVSGAAATGVRFEADLIGDGLAVAFPGWRQEPRPLASARVSGTWTTASDEGRLDDLAFAIDDLAGRGTLSWRREGGDVLLDASLDTPRLPLPRLLQWLPDDPANARLRERIRDGFMEIRSARFTGPAAALRRPFEHLPLEAEFAIDGLTLLARGQELRETAFSATLRDRQIAVSGGRLLLFGKPLRFTGSVTDIFAAKPSFAAEGEGEFESAALASLFPQQLPAALTLTGVAGVRAAIAGTADAVKIDLRADVTSIEVRRDLDLLKAAGEKGELSLSADLSADRATLRDSRLRLPLLEIRASGRIDRNARQAFRLNADLLASNLIKARERLPLLATLKASGGLALHLDVAGAEGKIRQRSGWIKLKKAGFHLTRAVADLHQVDGTITLTDDRLEFERVTALLGTSPVVLAGKVENFADPEVRLRIWAKSVRANELIFRSPTIYLHDVEGDLRLNRRRISFERVDVRLDGGTRAVVRGRVDFGEAEVLLEIDAEHGNIDEVIALWQGPAPPGHEHGKRVRVQITARVREGRLGPLRFQQAVGEISHLNGELSIFPLNFTAEGGRCSGRVIVRTAETPARLQVSGHVEEMDAAAVHLELLQRRGLVTGQLKGDFYLEGQIGPKFIETSTGGGSVEIERGVLRKFRSLARVFSLLNVSQIFALQLPDMAREGMPFDRVTGTFRLQEGILATEDLFVDSEAMNLSLVGQIDLRTEMLDFVLGVKPLRTVDKIVTRIPLAGWILTGEEKALITAHFLVRGPAADAEVVPVPITSISEKVVGIFRRVFGLPGRVIEGVGEFVRPN